MSSVTGAEAELKKGSLKVKVVFILVFFLALFFLETIAAYNYLNYMQTATSSGSGIVDFAMSTMNPFQNVTLKINLNTFLRILKCIGSAWWFNLIFLLVFALLLRTKRPFADIEHGSARWLTAKEKKKFYTTKKSGVIPIANDIFINPEDNDLNNINEIVLGGSGSGKSFTKLIPDIMYQYGSYVITDVKGDLYKFLYKILIKNGYKVRVCNLENLKYSNTFNPILYCETDTDIDKLVNTFVINSRREGANTGEGFWEDTLSMLLFSAVRYITETEGEQKTFYRCLQLAASIELVNGIVSPYCEIERIMTELERKNPYSSAVLNWKLVKQAPAETLQSVIISLTSRLRLWANEDLRIMTQSDEMNFDGLCEEKTAIFLIVPEGDRTYNCISSMFISTAVQRLKSLAKNKYNGSLPRLVSFELDEFANTGILPDWAAVVSTIRSQNIRAMMILQDLQQLKKNYDKSEKTIMSNCAIFNYLGTTEPDTIKMISERLGKTTIKGRDLSYRTGGIGTENGNVSERRIGRSLLEKDEVAILPKDKCIVFFDNHHPIYAEKFKTEKHSLFEYLGNNTGSHTVNNTDIAEVYTPIYEKHRQTYLNSLNSKGTVNLFENVEEAGDVRERMLNNNKEPSSKENEIAAAFEQFVKEAVETNTTQKQQKTEEQSRIKSDEAEKNIERQFLRDLKSLNK